MRSDKSLDGKTVLLTGAAGDIGTATTRSLLARGAHVVAADRADLTALERELGCLRLHCVETDVTNEASVKSAILQALKPTGRLDGFVNGAGVEGAIRTIPDLDLRDFTRVLDVNVCGVFLGLKHVIPVMQKAGGGSIVNLASTAGLAATPGASAYIASKHAVIGLTRAAAAEWASSNIRVNCVAPGPVEGRMITAILDGLGATGEVVRSRIPAGRFADPDDVASLIAFLISDDARHIHGAVIPVDGGRTAV